MSGVNRVILVGRIAVEPELRYTPNGTQVANFILAVDRNRPNAKGEREADFIKVVVWRRLAEICAQYLNKGRLIAVEGRLQTRSYETQEGQKRKDYEVVADGMKMLERGPKPDALDEAAAEDNHNFSPDENLEGISSQDLPF